MSGLGLAGTPAAARPKWRLAAGLAAGALAIAGSRGLADPLATMSGYTAALMVLNQAVPPLLLAAIPAGVRARLRAASGAAGRDWLLDPCVAGAVFALFTTAVSLPAVLGPTLSNALFAAPLGAGEVLAGLLAWMQLDVALRPGVAGWRRFAFAQFCAVPMTVVAVVWMFADHVLYAPYLDVICRWDIPPLVDQRWAGFVMLLAGLPMQVAGAAALLHPAPDHLR